MDNQRSDRGPEFWDRFDSSLFGIVILMCGVGLLTLYSSTYLDLSNVFLKQVGYVVSGLFIAFLITLLDYRLLERLALPIYILCIVLLILVDVVGKTALGSQRWLPLGPVHIQPSELAKLSIVIILARFFSREKVGLIHGYGLKELMPVMFLVGLPMALVFKQPDLGTALMIAFVAFTITFYCNLRIKTLVIMLVTFSILAPLAFRFALKPYQKERITNLFNPEHDPLGGGYHAIQSKITIGSGQLMGKGYLKGTQSKLDFLPKHHTDFIFSAFAEEWGFVGSVLLLSLFAVFVFLGVDICRKSKDKFGSVLAMGCLAVVVWHVIVNIGMEVVLLPVVGVTLPFFSYGGSSLITNMIAVGILSSVSLRRHIF